MVTDWIIAFRRTEMVWDDAMQEPTAADHGDVLYNIGVNQACNYSCFHLFSQTSNIFCHHYHFYKLHFHFYA